MPERLTAFAGAVGLLGLLLVWEAAARGFGLPIWLLPAPSDVGAAMAKWSGTLPLHFAVTLYETLAGFAASILIGVPLAVAIVSSTWLQATLWPVLLLFQSVPKVAVAPLLLLWVGYGEAPKIIVVFLVAFFPIVVNAAAGLQSAPPAMLDLARSLGATRLQLFLKVRLRAALPSIFVGLRVAVTFAVIGAVIGEFVGAERGLGYLILVSGAQSQTPLAFAAMVLLTAMSVGLYYAVEAAERLIVPWARPSRRPGGAPT